MKVLVTGASGFIGSYVIEKLLSKNISVVATSLTSEKIKQKPWFEEIIYRQYDFFNPSLTPAKLFAYFENPEILIDLAWTDLKNYRSIDQLKNVVVHFNFIEALIKEGLKNVNVTGTCLEYGMNSGCLQEDMCSNPILPYPIAKNTLRQLLLTIQNKNDFSLKWLRLFYIYGEDQEHSLIASLNEHIEKEETEFNMSGGEQIRDYLHVEELAEMIVNCSLQTKVTGIINCSSNIPVRLLDFVKTYLEQKGKSINLNLGYYDYPDYEPMEFWGDNTKYKSILSQ